MNVRIALLVQDALIVFVLYKCYKLEMKLAEHEGAIVALHATLKYLISKMKKYGMRGVQNDEE